MEGRFSGGLCRQKGKKGRVPSGSHRVRKMLPVFRLWLVFPARLGDTGENGEEGRFGVYDNRP